MLVITGSPGVGKRSIARIIADKLSLKLTDINEIAIQNKAYTSKENSSYVVDLTKLSELLSRINGKEEIVVGHLAPYVLSKDKVSRIAVIRRSPYELEKVYKERKYDVEKTADNLCSEIIGVCLYDSIKRFGSDLVAEFDNSDRKPEETADRIIEVFQGNSKPTFGSVDWLSVIAENEDMQRFFEYEELASRK